MLLRTWRLPADCAAPARPFLRSSNRVRGLTTAASLWVASAVGLACGLGFYIAALVAALATLVVLWLERPIARMSRKHESTVVRAVLTSPVPTGELVAAIERAGASAKRVHRSIRPDGSTEFEISGIQSAATQRVVSEIEARGDLIEVTYSIE